MSRSALLRSIFEGIGWRSHDAHIMWNRDPDRAVHLRTFASWWSGRREPSEEVIKYAMQLRADFLEQVEDEVDKLRESYLAARRGIGEMSAQVPVHVRVWHPMPRSSTDTLPSPAAGRPWSVAAAFTQHVVAAFLDEGIHVEVDWWDEDEAKM